MGLLLSSTDTLRFRLRVQKSMPQEDLRIGVKVTALVPAVERGGPELEGRVRDALKTLIDADWSFSRVARATDGSGYERVELRAFARVPVTENFNLAERARAASREGMVLSSPTADYSLSRSRVDQAMEELRLEALLDAERQAVTISERTGRSWRVGDIVFGVSDWSESAGRLTAKGGYRGAEDEAFADEPDDEEASGLAPAERVSLIASITLKSNTPASRRQR